MASMGAPRQKKRTQKSVPPPRKYRIKTKQMRTHIVHTRELLSASQGESTTPIMCMGKPNAHPHRAHTRTSVRKPRGVHYSHQAHRKTECAPTSCTYWNFCPPAMESTTSIHLTTHPHRAWQSSPLLPFILPHTHIVHGRDHEAIL